MLGTYYIIVIYTKYSPIHVLVLYMYVWCGVIVNACELYRNFAGFAFGLLFSFLSFHNPMVLRNVVQQAHRKLFGFSYATCVYGCGCFWNCSHAEFTLNCFLIYFVFASSTILFSSTSFCFVSILAVTISNG